MPKVKKQKQQTTKQGLASAVRFDTSPSADTKLPDRNCWDKVCPVVLSRTIPILSASVDRPFL